MHDWNVDPHMAVPTINTLIDAGIEARGLFGQWDHDYPDRPVQLDDRSEIGGRGGEAFPEMVRFDWMQDMLEWFDYYLKDIGEQPGQWIEIQSNQGSWRIEDRYPPEDITTLSLTLGGDMTNVGGTTTVLPDASSGPVWESEPLGQDTYIAGLPRVHVEVTTATLGGQLYALLEDCDDQSNCIHLGHAIMDLRYHAGGDEVQTWTPVVESITARTWSSLPWMRRWSKGMYFALASVQQARIIFLQVHRRWCLCKRVRVQRSNSIHLFQKTDAISRLQSAHTNGVWQQLKRIESCQPAATW